MSLYRVIQGVGTIDVAVSFYSAVLGTAGVRVSRGRYYFTCGGTVLACYDPLADGDEPGPGWRHHPHQYLYFASGELEHAMERVRLAGGTLQAPTASMPWGERLFHAADPIGNPIAFVDQETIFTGAAEQP